jgi:NAD+ diphosphatase
MTKIEQIAFAGADGQLDRAAHLRGDEAQIARLHAAALITPIWRGKVAVDDTQSALLWLPASHAALQMRGTRMFLGMANGRALFAQDLSDWQPDDIPDHLGGFLDATCQNHPDFAQGQGFVDLRGVMTQLSPLDAEAAATAKALLSWHDSHGFCARCGAASTVSQAGWQRHCPACNTHHFPRTDPVVIMLVIKDDRLLLGRSPAWPEGMYSLLAGFVEPGEVLEAAVRREVFEETGIRIGDVRYLASQPWPFPASLMLGCVATAISDDITIDPAELENALWLTRQEVLDVQLGRHSHVKAGRQGAIAQAMIAHWLAGCVD